MLRVLVETDTQMGWCKLVAAWTTTEAFVAQKTVTRTIGYMISSSIDANLSKL